MNSHHPTVATAMLALLLFATLTPQNAPADPQAQLPGTEVVSSAALSWGASELPGIDLAVVSGDPAKGTDIFVLRARMRKGAKFPVHTHPGAENVTVLKGTLLVGVGDKFDATKTQALAAGDFIRIPGGLHHFAQAQDEVVIQVSGLGPFSIQYANPADVPAKAPPKTDP